MADAKKTENAGKTAKSGLGKWLIAGALTATAAGAFFTFSPGFKSNTPDNTNTPPAVTETATDVANVNIEQTAGVFPAMTKDQKVVKFQIDMRALKAPQGLPNIETLQNGLNGYMTYGVMTTVANYNLSELSANIPQIEKALNDHLATYTVGFDTKAGKAITGKPGEDFSAPKIQKITDGQTNKVVWSAKPAGLQKLGL